MTYNDITYNDITYDDITYNDITYNDITYNDIAYMILLIMEQNTLGNVVGISKLPFTQRILIQI